MPRPIHLWLCSLAVSALSACSGSGDGFFSAVVTAGSGGASHAGASTDGGSPWSAGSPGNPGSAGSAPSSGGAGEDEAGDGNGGGAQIGGAGGSSRAGAHSGGTAGSSVGAAGAGTHAGGSGAAAGHPGANGGSAGVGGTNQDLSCSELIKLAAQQLDAARECNPTAKAIQCTGTVTTPCHCDVPVQKDTSAETKAYLNTLKQLDDQNCVQVCSALACLSPDNAQCKASAGSDTGSCVSSHGPGP